MSTSRPNVSDIVLALKAVCFRVIDWTDNRIMCSDGNIAVDLPRGDIPIEEVRSLRARLSAMFLHPGNSIFSCFNNNAANVMSWLKNEQEAFTASSHGEAVHERNPRRRKRHEGF